MPEETCRWGIFKVRFSVFLQFLARSTPEVTLLSTSHIANGSDTYPGMVGYVSN